MTMTTENIKELENFINEGIRPIDATDDLETAAYINGNREIKQLFEENDLKHFISKVQLKESQLGNKQDSERVKAKQEAYRDLINKYNELYY